MRLFSGLALGLPLAACGGGTIKQDDSQQRVMAMGEPDRRAVLLRSIRAAHRRCEQVVTSRSIEPPGPIPTYVAQCDNGDRYIVFIRPNGQSDVQITSAAGQ